MTYTSENWRLRDEIERLNERLALRFTCPPPPDVAPPLGRDEPLRTGWLYDLVSQTAIPACTSASSHAAGTDKAPDKLGSKALYSSKERALAALRHELELIYAANLRHLDKQISGEDK